MPAILLNLLPLLKSNWKLIAVVLILLGAFGTGWKVNGWRLETRYAEEASAREEAVREELTRRIEQMRATFNQQVTVIERQRDALNAKLAEISAANDALSAEIESTPLVKPTTDVTCIDNETGIAHEQPPNPFSGDFVRLWNSAGRVRND